MKVFLSCLGIVTIFSTALFSCSSENEAAGLELRNGWVRALPPGKAMTAAYGELQNNSTGTIRLIAYDSDSFSSVSLHQSIVENGVSRMLEQTDVQIAAGEILTLQPGGLHLMLMRPSGKILVGNEVEIGIQSDGQRFVFKLPVEAR
jgi:copper(I)-binding protein